MEKLVYVVWKSPELSAEQFKRHMLEEAAPRLLELGARRLSMCLADEHAEYAQGLRITHLDEPIAGAVDLWLDTALDRGPAEGLLGELTARLAGYSVLESVPIVNTSQRAPLGQRTPGIQTIGFLERPEWLSHEAWLEQWQGHHTRVAIETQSTFLYVQNVVVRALTEAAPPWAAIVQEGFPERAPLDPMVFYAAEGSPEKLEQNRGRTPSANTCWPDTGGFDVVRERSPACVGSRVGVLGNLGAHALGVDQDLAAIALHQAL
jgi:hypothetical protein